MTKSKRNALIIVIAAVLVAAIALSLGLGLTLGKSPQNAFAAEDRVSLSVHPKDGEILKTSVTVSDLSEKYKNKLFNFTSTISCIDSNFLTFDEDKYDGDEADFWFSDSVFRNGTSCLVGDMFWGAPYDIDKYLLPLVESGKLNQSVYNRYKSLITTGASHMFFDWRKKTAYMDLGGNADIGDDNVLLSVRSVSDMRSDYKVTYFGKNNKLKDGEVVVSKWVYYSLYARMNELSIGMEKVEEILDSENTLAKHFILRSSMGYGWNLYGSDGMAMEYYGILPQNLCEPLEITLYDDEDSGKSQTFKVVGYFEDESLDNRLRAFTNVWKDMRNDEFVALTFNWREMEKFAYIK